MEASRSDPLTPASRSYPTSESDDTQLLLQRTRSVINSLCPISSLPPPAPTRTPPPPSSPPLFSNVLPLQPTTTQTSRTAFLQPSPTPTLNNDGTSLSSRPLRPQQTPTPSLPSRTLHSNLSISPLTLKSEASDCSSSSTSIPRRRRQR